MNKNRPEITELRHRIENSVNRSIKTPSDFDFLSGAIWERTHETISPTTLKRLWGYIDGADTTRNSTLNLLAHFVGCADWDDFLVKLDEENDVQSNLVIAHHINTSDLLENDLVEVAWQPNRHCVFRYLGNMIFEVQHSENSKLKVGNTFQCSLFMLGEPLYIDCLVQNGSYPVAFVVGNKSGLTLLQKLAK